MIVLHGLLALFVFLMVAVLLSENRKAIKIKPILIGLFAQIILAIIIRKVPFIVTAFQYVDKGVLALNAATTEGTSFVFGYIGGVKYRFILQALLSFLHFRHCRL